MRALCILALTLAVHVLPLRADADRAGEFDYYVLALSWSPGWCAVEGTARRSPQCAPERDLGWMLHGLWPQHERGWPSYCPTDARPPTRQMTREMADIMGTAGLARHEWEKHGQCSGLSAQAYFAASRQAYEAVKRPAVFRGLKADVTLPARIVEEAFLEVNPALSPDMLTVTCKAGRIREVRICLTRDLAPRRCGADVVRDCSLGDAVLDAIP